MLQELARDVPQGVAAHDDIGIGVIATDALCHGLARHHQQCDCKTRAKPPRKALKHARPLLAPLGICRHFPTPARPPSPTEPDATQARNGSPCRTESLDTPGKTTRTAP